MYVNVCVLYDICTYIVYHYVNKQLGHRLTWRLTVQYSFPCSLTFHSSKHLHLRQGCQRGVSGPRMTIPDPNAPCAKSRVALLPPSWSCRWVLTIEFPNNSWTCTFCNTHLVPKLLHSNKLWHGIAPHLGVGRCFKWNIYALIPPIEVLMDCVFNTYGFHWISKNEHRSNPYTIWQSILGNPSKHPSSTPNKLQWLWEWRFVMWPSMTQLRWCSAPELWDFLRPRHIKNSSVPGLGKEHLDFVPVVSSIIFNPSIIQRQRTISIAFLSDLPAAAILRIANCQSSAFVTTRDHHDTTSKHHPIPVNWVHKGASPTIFIHFPPIRSRYQP